MSRITGILGQVDSSLQADHDVMQTAVREKNWTSGAAKSGDAVMGWCGWAEPGIAEEGGVIAVLDGHIYNAADLGKTTSDAELLITLYRKHGFEGALSRINGDFALALYDPTQETLWLARDRFGLKPLYYLSQGRRFAFASRPACLLALPGVSSDINRRYAAIFAGSHYRYFDNSPDESPFAGIAQLPAGHYLKVKGGQASKHCYWALEEQPDYTEPEDVLAGRYLELLTDAVRIRLAAVSRPAFTLSGGMDSSSVLASALRVSGSKQHAISTVYSDKTYDESADIHSMLAATVEQWHPVAVDDPDVIDLVRRMVALHDEPVATATWLSHYLLCAETARQGFGGLFGGLGGDELNAGEYEYFLFFFADLRAAGDNARLKREVEHWARYHDHPIYRKNMDVVEQAFSDLMDLSQPGKCLPDRRRLTRYSAALNPEYFELTDFAPVMDHPFASYLKNRTYQDIFRETAPCCLRAEDRHTTAFGLDNALPFFDHRLVEFMFRVPGTLKYRDGVTKHLLRQAMRGVLPEETRTRVKKTGWNAPAHLWFSGRGKADLLDLVNSQSFQARGIYDVAEVYRLIEEHDQIVSSGEPRENHMMFLWQLVNLELWLQVVDARRNNTGAGRKA